MACPAVHTLWKWNHTLYLHWPQITGAVQSGYNALAPLGGSTADIGATVTFQTGSAALTPSAVTINGQACSLDVVAAS